MISLDSEGGKFYSEKIPKGEYSSNLLCEQVLTVNDGIL